MIFEIDNEKLKINILHYIHKNNLVIRSTLFDKIKYMVFSSRNRKNEEYIIGIGRGTHTFVFENFKFQITYKQEGTPKGTDHGVKTFNRMTIEVNNKEVFKNFLGEVSKKNTITEKLTIYTNNEYGDWDICNEIEARKLKSVYIPESIKSKILNSIKFFINSEDDYNKFGIPYKKTFLLTGIPGGGKTSLIKSICNEINYDLSILTLSNKFNNDSLIFAIKHLEKNTILLIEDIDCIFEKREKADNSYITFSNLINVLDGVLYKHGNIIFLTTNYPDKLDNSLLRTGRIDCIVEINYPGKKEIKNLFIDMSNGTEDQFNIFYKHVKDHKIPMCAFVNFLFMYKTEWLENISVLIDSNSFIRKTLKQDIDKGFYT